MRRPSQRQHQEVRARLALWPTLAILLAPAAPARASDSAIALGTELGASDAVTVNIFMVLAHPRPGRHASADGRTICEIGANVNADVDASPNDAGAADRVIPLEHVSNYVLVVEREGVPARYVKSLVIRFGKDAESRNITEISCEKRDLTEGPVTLADVRDAVGEGFRFYQPVGIRAHLERYDSLYDQMIRYRPVVEQLARAAAPATAPNAAAPIAPEDSATRAPAADVAAPAPPPGRMGIALAQAVALKQRMMRYFSSIATRTASGAATAAKRREASIDALSAERMP